MNPRYLDASKVSAAIAGAHLSPWPGVLQYDRRPAAELTGASPQYRRPAEVIAEVGLRPCADIPGGEGFARLLTLSATLDDRILVLDGDSAGVGVITADGSRAPQLFAEHRAYALAYLGDERIAFATRQGIHFGTFDGGVVATIPWRRQIRSLAPGARNGHLLIVEVNGEVLEIDAGGQVVWTCLLRPGLAKPNHAAFDPRTGLRLVADDMTNRVIWLDSNSHIVAQFGGERPRGEPHQLFAPKHMSPTPCGWLITDSYHNRVVEVGVSGQQMRWSYGDSRASGSLEGLLWRPVAAAALGRGTVAIADSKNRRVVFVARSGRVAASIGHGRVARAELLLPRSVHRDGDRLLIADTYHDRVVSARPERGGWRIAPVVKNIAWPRCATPFGDLLLISEGRRHLIREHDAYGRFTRAWPSVDGEAFHDPHEIARCASGEWLITDTAADRVLRLSLREGRATAVRTERPLRDPHGACELPGGAIAIANTGYGSVLVVETQRETEITQIDFDDGSTYRLCTPRHCAPFAGGLILADTDGGCIIACTAEGRGLWRIDDPSVVAGSDAVYGFGKSLFYDPKWVLPVAPGLIAIGDTGNNRILLVRPPEP